MRLDIWLWLAGDVLAVLAGLIRLLPRRAANPHRARRLRLWAPVVLTLLGLASLVAGLVWRMWPSGAWPGSTTADGVAMLAAGTLAILSWIMLTETRHAKATEPRVAKSRDGAEAPCRVDGVSGGKGGLDRSGSVAEALALFGSCLLILLAVGAAWSSPFPEPSPLARSWLFGVRVIAASLGLGAWLPAFAAESRALGGDAARGLRPRNRILAESRAFGGEGEENIVSTGPAESRALGGAAMRAGYPWLTAAWLLGAIWSLAATAALWHGLGAAHPEAWLMVAWLLGGIYLFAACGAQPAQPVRLPQWALFLLAALGMAAALLQAWQTPLLLSS